MAVDAFDPGPNGDYPNFPRNAAGEPLWSDTPEADGVPVGGVTPMPRGLRSQEGMLIDITPRGPGGVVIDPPVVP
jgi:hypothetical protein